MNAEEKQRFKASFWKRLEETHTNLKALQAGATGYLKLRRQLATTGDACSGLKADLLNTEQQTLPQCLRENDVPQVGW